MGMGFYFHPNEIGMAEEQERIEKEQQERLDSCLESALLKNEPVVDEGDSPKVQPRRGLLRRILKKIFGKNREQEGNLFEPKFNAREEFAIWVRQEFPELWNGRLLLRYGAVNKRKKEVYEAAKKACEHGVKTTNNCVNSRFYHTLHQLSQSFYKSSKFGNDVKRLVEWIENVAPNLNNGELHYGTGLVVKRRK